METRTSATSIDRSSRCFRSLQAWNGRLTSLSKLAASEARGYSSTSNVGSGGPLNFGDGVLGRNTGRWRGVQEAALEKPVLPDSPRRKALSGRGGMPQIPAQTASSRRDSSSSQV